MEAKRRPSVGSQGASWPVVRAAALRHALAVAHSGVVDESRSEQDGAPPSRDCYWIETTLPSRERGPTLTPAADTANLTSACNNKGRMKRSSTTPIKGIAKLNGSNAKHASAIEAGMSQRGRLGCCSAMINSRRS